MNPSSSQRTRAKTRTQGRSKPPDPVTAGQPLPYDFPKRLVQRAAHGPDFRRFARGHADILPRVGPTELQLALTAVHQPDWKVSVVADKVSHPCCLVVEGVTTQRDAG